MAEPMVSATMETGDVLAWLSHVPLDIDIGLREEARVTADRVAAEVRRRFLRAAKSVTNETLLGIHVEPTHDGQGFMVLGYSTTTPTAHGPVDYWLEYGTVKMRARPFFHGAAQLEEGGHLRRVAERIQRVCDGGSR